MIKRILIFAAALAVLLLLAVGMFYFFFIAKGEAEYQADAGKKRVGDIYEIAQLLEECKGKQGYYPFVDGLREPPEEGYVTVPLAVMLSQPDQDWVSQPFPFSMSVGKYPAGALIYELSQCLERRITLPVDPQRRPYKAPNTYIALFTEDNSYVLIAFLYEGREHTSPLAEHAHAFSVSSDLGPVAKRTISGMKITPKKFSEINKNEIVEATAERDIIDARFSQWAIVRVSK